MTAKKEQQEVQDSIARPVDYKRLLQEALEVEDYELAALLRDRIKGLRVRECEKVINSAALRG